MPDHIGLGASGVVIHNNRILLVRPSYGPPKRQWIIPNGSLEPHETLDQAACREVAEETGLVCSVVGLLGLRSMANPTRTDITVFFMLTTDSYDLQPDPQEIEAAAFFGLPEIEALEAEGMIVPLSLAVARLVLQGEYRVLTRKPYGTPLWDTDTGFYRLYL